MTFATWFASRLNDTVTRAAKSSLSSYGDPSFGSQTTFLARVVAEEGFTRLSNGSEVRYTHRLQCQTAIALTDRLWLPGDSTGDNTAAKHPVKVEAIESVDGSTTVYRAWM